MTASISRKTFVQGIGALGLSALAVDLGLGRPGQVYARVSIKTRAHDAAQEVDRTAIYQLPFRASHVALYWEGDHAAHVTAAFSRDGKFFGPAHRVRHDELGEHRNDGRTYGAVMVTGGATVVRVASDRPLPVLNVLGMIDGERIVTYHPRSQDAQAAIAMPPVIARAGWGCDESLMTWSPAFYPVQKLICHHTATQNNDPDPAATIRSIYYYHAVTQNWGDIGYNFLVDEAGRIYEGRYSRSYGPSEYPTGEDLSGHGVTAAHAAQFNSGTVGIALLGTLTSQDTTPNGRRGIEQMLAWKANAHGINPHGTAVYTNPVTLVSTTFPNIAGHRDVNSTECPGGVFYGTLPTIRNDVAAMLTSSATSTSTPTPTQTVAPTRTPTPKPKRTPTPTKTPTRTGGGGNN